MDPAPITLAEFDRLRQIVVETTGVHLTEDKQMLVVARLWRRLRDLGVRSFDAYADLVRASPVERDSMVDRILTNETRFFREPSQFQFIEAEVIPHWKLAAERGLRPRRVLAWCAGCATGEEPVSLAMALRDQLPGWSIDIVATDLSRRALDLATRFTYSIDRLPEIPERYHRAFLLKGVDESSGLFALKPEFRRLIRYQRSNLVADSPPGAQCDLVLCRNVMIYFAPEVQGRVIRKLVAALAPEGRLLVGHAENLLAYREVRPAGPGMYCLARG